MTDFQPRTDGRTPTDSVAIRTHRNIRTEIRNAEREAAQDEQDGDKRETRRNEALKFEAEGELELLADERRSMMLIMSSGLPLIRIHGPANMMAMSIQLNQVRQRYHLPTGFFG